ncbi:MAG TPA: UbiA family prenyltransferase, partial [Candidatus Dormibacteraeota bacterium]|nr:UbiA family prenyltransferase [Candidatus Dormibacteraeota bacterium]
MLFGLLLGLRAGDRRLWLVALAMLAAQFSISALNDWADADADAAAGRLRPIPLALVSRREALIVALAFGALGLAGSLAIGRGGAGILLFAIGLGCGWLYDLALKATPFSFLPFAVAFPLLGVWVGLAAGRPPGTLLPFFAVAAPLGIAIHLADSVPDLASDAASGSHGLAVTLGRSRTVMVIQGARVLGSLLVVKSFLDRLPV